MNNSTLFLLPVTGGVEIIDPATVIRIEAISNYSKLHFAGGKTLVVAKLLRWFEERLIEKEFIRIHRTHLVNAEFIRRYANGKVELNNQQLIDVSRSKKAFFLAKLAKAVA